MSNSLRAISEIATDIRAAWPNVYFGAVPYLDAMDSLATIQDNYFADRGKDIVLYFLANANTFRGEQARQLKAELREWLK